MRTSDPLFDLIHSLKKEEKRHFKLYAKKYTKSSNYVALFDLVAKADTPNDARLKARLADLPFSGRLAVAKEYLYSLILKGLRDTEPTTPEATVLRLIEDSDQLLERRLFSAAKKRIRKAAQLTELHELTGERLVVSNLEGLLPEVDRDRLLQREGQIIKEADEIYRLGLFAEAMRKFKEAKGSLRTTEDREELTAIARSCPVSDPNNLLTFSGKLRYHFGWFMYFQCIDDDANIEASLHSIIALYDAHPQHIQTQQLAYISIVMNLASRQLKAGRLELVPALLYRVRELKANEQIKPYRELLLFGFAITEATAKSDWTTIDALHKQLPELLVRNASEVNSYGKDIRIDYYLHFAKAYFLQGKFEKALMNATELMQLSTLKSYPYQENNVRLLIVLLHYELGNRAYLPYLIRATYRALLRRDRLFEFEACILRYLGSLGRIKRERDVIPSFRKLLAEITSITEHPIDREFPWREFYLAWLRAKLENGATRGRSTTNNFSQRDT